MVEVITILRNKDNGELTTERNTMINKETLEIMPNSGHTIERINISVDVKNK